MNYLNLNVNLSRKLKKPFLLLCCALIISTPVFGVKITLVNKSGQVVKCYQKDPAKAGRLERNAKWSFKCEAGEFLTPQCTAYCFVKDQAVGTLLTPQPSMSDQKFNITVGKNNKPSFEKVKK